MLYPKKRHSLDSSLLGWNEQSKDREYEVVFTGEAPEFDSEGKLLNFLWVRHNVGDNEDGVPPQKARSMSVGDIVKLESGVARIVRPVGFGVAIRHPSTGRWFSTVREPEPVEV